MFIYKITEALDQEGIDYAIVGGFAVALHGAVRGTIDLDIILRLRQKDFEATEKVFKNLGLQPRLPVSAKEVFLFREEYIKNRSMIAWSFVHPKNPMEVVDIIITHDLSKMKVRSIRSGKHTLKILDVDDLIEMKELSGRPQDLEDIKALRELKK